MAYGSFVLMLHSHLPFYRKAGMWPFGEENLYECMLETYLPLLDMLYELKEEGIKAQITVGITPILAEQLADEHLKQGFQAYMKTRIEWIKDDQTRYSAPDADKAIPNATHLRFLADFYHQHYTHVLKQFEKTYNRDILKAFKDLQDQGCIEITTSGATHGFSPLLGTDASINAQYRIGVESYKKHFGKAPKGVWLPECAYRPAQEVKDPVTGDITLRPSIDAFLFENGLDHFFTEYHAIEGGISYGARRMVGVYGNIQYLPLSARPVTGQTTYEAYWMKDYPVSVLGRNERSSFQVWSDAHGYPGDGLYREFHKQDSNSGMKYWRLTSKTCDLADKMLYDPVQAKQQTENNATHFANLIEQILKEHQEQSGADGHEKEHGLVMVSFDTELFGHWWFEGILWLKRVLKQLHANRNINVETSTTYLKKHPPKRAISLPESTWGQGGHYWVWENSNTEWMWPIIHAAETRMLELVETYQNTKDSLEIRCLNQLLRELLLLESSDWPFLVTTFQAKDYAIERFNGHKENFWHLSKMIETQKWDLALLDTLEEQNNPFPNIDFRWYSFQNTLASKEPVTVVQR